MVRHFCSYFDRFYLPRALAMWRSLQNQSSSEIIWWVLCLDEATRDVLERLNLPRLHLFSLSEVEVCFPELSPCQRDRTLIEYYFTLSPVFPLFLMLQHPDLDMVTYLDADLFFYASPEPLFEELGGHSVGIIGHRFPPLLHDHECFGKFNVGWITFRNNDHAKACLSWWRDRCIESCHDFPKDGRYADQKYLDEWPKRFSGVKELLHPGANLAPWNLASHGLLPAEGSVQVDGQALIFYHFHDLKLYGGHFLEWPSRYWGFHFTPLLRARVYRPYIQALRIVEKTLSRSFDWPRDRRGPQRKPVTERRPKMFWKFARIVWLAITRKLVWC